MPIDFGDEAQDINEMHLSQALERQRKQTLSIPFSGACLSCGEPVHQRRFCDGDCRETWEQERGLRPRR